MAPAGLVAQGKGGRPCPGANFQQCRRFFALSAVVAGLFSVGMFPAQRAVAEDTSGGADQSPIDLREKDVVSERAERIVQYTEYKPLEKGEVLNTGQSLVVTGKPFGTIRVLSKSDNGVRRVFNAERLELHFPSEHTLNGRRFAGELQLVNSFEVTKGGEKELVIISALLEEGPENALLDALGWNDLPKKAGERRKVDGTIDPAFALPLSLSNFYCYDGSNTSPPYESQARWLVLEEPITVSEDQVKRFKELFPNGNARPVQPLGGRPVLLSADELPEKLKGELRKKKNQQRKDAAVKQTPP